MISPQKSINLLEHSVSAKDILSEYFGTEDDKPDMIYFFSEPLVDEHIDGSGSKQLLETKFEPLSTELEYN